MTVADGFDAMTSDRTYRSSMKTDEAISELKKVAGKQFDHEVVDAFASSEIIKTKLALETCS
jgi:HD-GYP domain-containing protein (c-di-GMP phosphodiesterase class II)